MLKKIWSIIDSCLEEINAIERDGLGPISQPTSLAGEIFDGDQNTGSRPDPLGG